MVTHFSIKPFCFGFQRCLFWIFRKINPRPMSISNAFRHHRWVWFLDVGMQTHKILLCPRRHSLMEYLRLLVRLDGAKLDWISRWPLGVFRFTICCRASRFRLKFRNCGFFKLVWISKFVWIPHCFRNFAPEFCEQAIKSWLACLFMFLCPLESMGKRHKG